MKLPSKMEFELLLKDARISRRLQRDIRYTPELIVHADKCDFLTMTTKSGNEGVLLFGDEVIPFTLERRRPNSNGRIEAIICDICATWQRGTNSSAITFQKDAKHSVSYLVCADLDCSLHVRDLTDASRLSRTQLREHITPEGRIKRLETKLKLVIDNIKSY